MTLVPQSGNDRVYTPDELAQAIVNHFTPSGQILEPCSGGGAFVRALQNFGTVHECELDRGQDFFDWTERVDWIITNPPWSKARKFLQHSYEVADDVVFLITVNHILALRARLRDMESAGFRVREVLTCDTPPPPWPQSGFQLAAIHIQRGYVGSIEWSSL